MMFGFIHADKLLFTWQFFLNTRMIALTAVAILGATVLGNEHIQAFGKRAVSTKLGYAVQEVGLIVLFVVSILFMVNSSYHPFIYFQY